VLPEAGLLILKELFGEYLANRGEFFYFAFSAFFGGSWIVVSAAVNG
jgi:hypothetical protein